MSYSRVIGRVQIELLEYAFLQAVTDYHLFLSEDCYGNYLYINVENNEWHLHLNKSANVIQEIHFHVVNNFTFYSYYRNVVFALLRKQAYR